MRALWLFIAVWIAFSTPAFAKNNEIYDRIIKSGTIHCGYSLWEPLTFVEPNTAEIKGIFADLMKEVARRLDLKLDWTEELGWDTVVESVRSGRVDMSCAGYWLNPARIKYLAFNEPQIYTPLYVWGRADITRSFNSYADFNSKDLTVVQIDGGPHNSIVERELPKLKKLNLPGSAGNGDVIASILTGKADFMIDDVTSFNAYNRDNPGKLKILFDKKPFAVYPATMLLPPDEPRLKQMIDGTLRLIELDGTLEAILKKYKVDKVFLRNPQPAVR